MAAAVNRPKISIPATPKAENFYTFSRYKVFFLGSKNPWWFTQLIFIIGLAGFLYFLFWNGLNFLAVSMVDTKGVYSDPEKIKNIFFDIGLKYHVTDAMVRIKWMALVNVIGAAIMFFGLIVMYRRKKPGYTFVFVGLAVCMLSPIAFMGFKYIQAETRWFEYSFALILAGLMTLDMRLSPIFRVLSEGSR